VKLSVFNNKRITKLIPHNYIFENSINIKNYSNYKCHRGINGSFNNEQLKFKSYTMIIYLEDMDKCLGVIPKSHYDKNAFNYNSNDELQNIMCNGGDVIIYNSNTISADELTNKINKIKLEFTLIHNKDSFYKLNLNVKNNIDDMKSSSNNNLPFFLQKIDRKFSCMFPILQETNIFG